jgi:beta-N-acetylhexosaminidase
VKRFIQAFCALFLILGSAAPLGVWAQNTPPLTDPQVQAAALLAKLTPEERIGQLFLVTFKGIDVSETSQIYDLVFNHHVGGVILLAKNDNFITSGKTASEVYRLASDLQKAEWSASQKFASDPLSGSSFKPSYIPLLVGTSQEGDGYPYDQIINGVTEMPNAMAIGATWKPALATQVGKVIGSELQVLGFNFYLGPSLDVLETLQGVGQDDLGTRAFGGDPYWVGEMGKAFITGIHQGSNNRIAVIAKHFPGRGASDRSPEEEVATVRKSLDELKNFDLAPFFSVTGNTSTTDATTDGLLVSHIRYQGFQGNIRDTTRPVSSDASALSQLMSLPAIASWRDKGGLVVSDDLGSRAVRRFYDPSERTFDSYQVARTAFLAGNDLLYVDNFTANGDPDSYTSILRTLEYFTQKYREDSAFKERVDASVTRILALKYKLYGTFTSGTVIPSENGLMTLDKSQAIVSDVARQAVTLISPAQSELGSVLPKPPELREHLIFFTDVMTGKQCSLCAEQSVLAVDALQRDVLRLYGPQVGGQVIPDQLSSYSLTDLQNYLNKADVPADLEENLTNADWVVFAFLNPQTDRPGPNIIRQLLSDRPDLIRNKRVIAFAFNAPYYLDATDISKLTAYYALYSKAPGFIETAARVLFQEMPISGALPVSVPGIRYELITATSPDPDKIIPLKLDLPEKPIPTGTTTTTTTTTPTTPEPTVVPRFKVGDSIPLRTGLIYDHNHNPVPDNTPVRFFFTIGGDVSSIQTIDAVTVQGIAHIAYRIEKAGLVEIHATSEPAKRSDQIFLDTSGKEGAAITAIAPTPLPTITPTATATVTPTVTPTVTLTPTPSPTPTLPPRSYPNVIDWSFSLFVIAAGAAISFFAAFGWKHSILWGLRSGLCACLGGLAAYLYLAIGLPGSAGWVQDNGTGGIIGITSLGAFIGLASGIVWWLVHTNRKTPSMSH